MSCSTHQHHVTPQTVEELLDVLVLVWQKIPQETIRHLIRSRSIPVADGDSWRLLNPGEYRLTVSAEGYYPSSHTSDVMYDHFPTICDFNLTKIPRQRIKDILAKGGKLPKDLQLRQLRMRKLCVTTKAINQRCAVAAAK